MPAAQVPEFNRLIGLMNACSIHLPIYITLVEQRTEQLYLRFSAQQTLVRFGTSLWEVAKLVPAAQRPRAEKLVADFSLADLPWQPEDREESWLNVAERTEQALRVELGLLWQELRAIDAVVDDVRGEFNNEDPLQPVMRAVVEKVRRELLGLHRGLAAAGPVTLPEPDEELLELARTYFENGRRLMDSL